MVGSWNIEKLAEPFFPGKFIFGPNLGKRAQNGPKIKFWLIFEKFCDVSFYWKQSIMKTNILLIFYQEIWHTFGSQVIGQNAASQSNCRILLNVIL